MKTKPWIKGNIQQTVYQQIFLWPVNMCFLDFQRVCVVSVALRLPAAYRSGTGSGKGRRVGLRDWKGGGAGDVGGNESGRKIVVVIRTEC